MVSWILLPGAYFYGATLDEVFIVRPPMFCNIRRSIYSLATHLVSWEKNLDYKSSEEKADSQQQALEGPNQRI